MVTPTTFPPQIRLLRPFAGPGPQPTLPLQNPVDGAFRGHHQVLVAKAASRAGAEVVDGRGGTLLPGLFDAHVHSGDGTSALALRFGVTTELAMQGTNTRHNRAHITENDTVADIRSAGFGITPPGGHPSELFGAGFRPGGGTADGHEPEGTRPDGDAAPAAWRAHPLKPFSTTPEEATAFIPKLIAAGSDYIKFMIDDGTVEGHPGLPMLDQATLDAGVAEAHRHGMLISHTR